MKDLPVRYSDEELAEFRAHIENKIAESKAELESTLKQIADLSENGFNQQGGDWYDDTTNHTDLEMYQRLAARQVDLLKHLNNALLRIHNKTYGVCFVTGKLIDKRRLMLVPHTTKSVEGKTRDKEEKEQGNHLDKGSTRLPNEDAPKEPRPLRPVTNRVSTISDKDTYDWNGPDGETMEDAGYTKKFDEDE